MKTNFIINRIDSIQVIIRHQESCFLNFPIEILISYFNFGILYNIYFIYHLIIAQFLHLNFNFNLLEQKSHRPVQDLLQHFRQDLHPFHLLFRHLDHRPVHPLGLRLVHLLVHLQVHHPVHHPVHHLVHHLVHHPVHQQIHLLNQLLDFLLVHHQDFLHPEILGFLLMLHSIHYYLNLQEGYSINYY